MSIEEKYLKDILDKHTDLINLDISAIEDTIDEIILQGYQNEQWFINALDKLNKISLKNLNTQSVRV